MSQSPAGGNIQHDLFGSPVWPREGVPYSVHILGIEDVWSATQGDMLRLFGEISRGVHAGCKVWKPLTLSLRGMTWMDNALRGCGLTAPKIPSSRRWFEESARLLSEAGDLEGVLYLYRHETEGVFPTLKHLRRINGEQAHQPV